MRTTIDGDACVNALIATGFRVSHRGQGLTLLRRGARVVLVPDVDELAPSMLDAILRSAGLSEEELAAHLPSASASSDARVATSERA